MVESGKSFIKNVRREGRGGIYNNLEAEKQAVKQQRAEQLADTTTVNELGNTDTQATDGNTSVVGKVAEKIVNSKVGQALIGVAETIPEKLNKFVEPAKEQAAENKQAKEDLLKTQIYEDTAKIEKVAGIREDGTQVAPSQARKVAGLMEQFDKSKLVSSVFKDAFPSFWETSDGQRVFRTDGQYIVDRPVGYTTDLLGTMQDAYNSVTYAYAQNGVVFTPDDLKKAYPEYANVSDGTLANFISGCLYDVQRGQRSDIKTIGDAMGEMSMAEGYTNRLDGYLDILSDESFMQFGWQRRFDKNKEGEVDMLNAGMFLKDIANQIRETGEFTEGFSDWAILNNYRHMKSDDEETQELINMIDQYMTLLEEKEAHEGITAFTATLYKNYLTNIEGAKVDLSDEDIEFWDALRIRVQEKTSQARDKFGKIVEELRIQSEDESRYPMKNFLEYTMLGRYVMDNKGNYYLTSPWTRQQELVYSRGEDGFYIDAKTGIKYTEEQVRSMTAGGISNGIVNGLTSIADKGAEALIDAERIGASYKMGGLGKTTQYDLAMAFDVLGAYWGLVQSIDPYLQLSTNAPVIGEPVEAGINAIISGGGELLIDMLVEMGIADGRTTESRDKAEEGLGVLFLMGFMKTVHLGKDMIIKSPKFKAYRKATDSFIKKISKSLKVFNKKGVERMIEQRNLELENEKLRREENIIKNQQKQNTTLEEDVRVKEKMSEKMTKETEQKKEEATKELVDKNKLPFFTLLKGELEKAKGEFFDEFYEEYKKQAGGEENMDQAVLLQKDLNDMADPEKKKKLIEKYNEIFLEDKLKRNLAEWLQFGEEIKNLRQQILDGIAASQGKTEGESLKTTKQIQEEQMKGKRPTKQYEKVEKKHLNLPTTTADEIRRNPFRYILKDILKEFIQPLNKKGEPVSWDSKDIVKFQRKVKNIDRVTVQERIMEKWKEMAQQYMNKLRENQKKIFDFKKEFFDTDIDYDIKDFFTKFLKETGVDNILSRLFKEGKISIEEVYDENGESKLEIRYNGEQRIPEEYVREAIDMFNEMFQEIQKYFKDGKLLLDEASLYELRSMMKRGGFTTSGKEKSGKFADVAQDLYTIFNNYLDTYREKTGIGKDIRPYDSAFSDFFELVDFLDQFFNKKGEIKKESRNRLIDMGRIAEDSGILDLLEEMIPGTKDMLRLMETGHDFITSMVTLMEKTDYKTWFGRRVLKYGPMKLTMELMRKLFKGGLIAGILAVPTGETAGEEVRSIFGRKRPLFKEIREALKQLDLTEEERKLLEEMRPKDFEDSLNELDANFNEQLKEILGDYEQGRQREEGPKAYDREGNEVVWTDENGNPPDGGDGGNGGNGPTGPKSGGPTETKTHESAKETSEDAATEQKIERETDDALAESFKDELSLLDNVSKQLNKLVVDFVAGAEDKKEAKMRVAAAGFKITNTIVSLLDSPEVRKAKEKAEKLMKKDDGYKELQELISKTTGDERRVYTNALYKLILAQKAPSTLVSIDPSELSYLSDADLGGLAGRDVGKQKKNTKYEQATARISGEDIEKEVENRDTVKNDDSDYDQIVKEGAKKSESKINKNKGDRITEGDVKGVDEQIQKKKNSDTAKGVDENDEQYQEDVETERTSDKYNVSNTERDLKKRLRITAKEGESTINEVGQLSPEKMTSRDNIWFSFDKFGNKKTKTKDRMRYNDKNQRIVNHKGKDYIDGGALYGTAEIDWGGDAVDTKGNPIDSPTKVYVNSLEVFDNFPSLEKLPEDTLVLDTSTNKVYTIDEIRRMDVHGETNKKSVEKYYEDLYNSYPKEVQDMFAEEGKTEKSQVQSSSEGKSEAKETQAEQSSTENEKKINSELGRLEEIAQETIEDTESISIDEFEKELEQMKSTPTVDIDKKMTVDEKRDLVLEAMQDPESFRKKYKDKKNYFQYLNIARIFEFYNDLPEAMQEKLIDTWDKTMYINSADNPWKNTGKFLGALVEGIEDNWNEIKELEADNFGAGKEIPRVVESNLYNMKDVVTRKEAKKIADELRQLSFDLDINIPEILKQTGKGAIIPLFGKPVPQTGLLGKHRPRSRNIEFRNNKLSAFHEVFHDITQSIAGMMRDDLGNDRGEAYTRDYFDETKMASWDSIKKRPKAKKYYTKPTEVISRGMEMYIAEKKGLDISNFKYYDGYWTKEVYESDIKPMIEEYLKDVRDYFGRNKDNVDYEMYNKYIDEVMNDLIKEGYYDLPDTK